MPAQQQSKASAAEAVASPTCRVVTGQLDEGPEYGRIRPRGTSDWLMLATVAGAGSVRTEGQTRVVADSGSFILIEPYTPQDYRTHPDVGRWSLRWAHAVVPPDWEPLLDWPQVGPGLRRLAVDDDVGRRVVADLDRAISAQRRGLRRSERFAMNAVESALLWCDTQNPQQPALDSRLLLVLDYIGDHLDQPQSLASLAEVAGLSATRLAHVARAQLGISLMAHLERQRMELARQLLLMTDLPVSELSRRVGYSDPLYFSRRFRKATTLSPSEFRARGQG